MLRTISAAAVIASASFATGAYAANPNVPTYSPYTLIQVPGSVPDVARTSKPAATADQVYEGRAAYERPAFPMSLLPFYWFQN